MPLEIPELTMGPCRDFGLPGLEEIARLPSPTVMPAYVKRLVGQLEAEGIVPGEEALYLAELVDALAAAPGLVCFLDEGKKKEKVLRLYGISRRLSSTSHPLRDDLLLAIGIILFNLSPSEKLADRLAELKPRGGPLSYEYHSMMALNELLKDRLEEAGLYANKALEAARDPDRRAYVRMLKGCIELRKGDPEAAIGYLDDCGATDRLRARASFYAGIVRYEKKDFRDALRRFESAGAGASDELDILAVKCNVGACAVNLGDLGLGEKEFQEVNRSTWKKSGHRELHRKLLSNSYMGIISRALGHYPEAENYYKEALKACIKLNNTVGIANQVGNMGLLHRRSGDPTTALRLFNACLLYSERMGYWKGIRFSYENVLGTLVDTGKAPEARKFKEMYTSRYPGLR
ncbi:MAG TPA: tetratricopeptide repeat protein [Methanocella sp.]|nr:tetratricopeptide repeat protein [Methanocella sp.]